MKAVVAAFNQEKALVGAFSVVTNLRMELFEALLSTDRDLLPLDGPAGLYEGGLVHAVGGPALPGQGVAQRRAQPVCILFVVLQLQGFRIQFFGFDFCHHQLLRFMRKVPNNIVA